MFYFPYLDDEEETPTENPLVNKIKLPDGSFAMICAKCMVQFQWAEPNQDDNTFKCYTCRKGL